MDDFCRICLEARPFLVDLRTCQYEKDFEVLYYEIFVTIVDLRLDQTEASLICGNCKDLLSSAYELRIKARKSADYLRKGAIEFVEAKCEVQIKVEKEDLAPAVKEEAVPEPKIEPISKKSWKFLCRFCLCLYEKLHFKQKCENLHVKSNNGLQCHHCDYRTTRRNRLKAHINRHLLHPSINFECFDCPCTYPTKALLRQHQKISHPKKTPSSFICPICGQKLRNRKILKGHMARAHDPDQNNVRKFICDICGKRFITLNEVKMHIETVHLNLRRFECLKCGNFFKRRECLKQHLVAMHPEKEEKFDCPVCGKVFKTPVRLKVHQTIHTSDYKYKCAVEGCQAVFKQTSCLKVHRLVHAPQQVFRCEFPGCTKKFRYVATLKSHKRIHNPGESHHCQLCGKSYTMAFKLKEHEEVVHQGKRYECPACGCGMTSKNNLNRHVKLHCTEGVKKRL